MNKKVHISWEEVLEKLSAVDKQGTRIYGVPKGGMILTAFLNRAKSVHSPEYADLILDDVVDSGRTREKYMREYPDKWFFSLFDICDYPKGTWLVFPWETDHPSGEETIQQNITRQLQYIGESPEREGLVRTPERVVKAWDTIFSGYKQDPAALFVTFDSGEYDQIVLLKDIEIFSMCEHHMMPFYGKAHVAYIPDKRVIGISKLARLIDIYSRRLQIQERIGSQVANDLMKYLEPKGTACIIEAVHMCMRMRGVSKQNSTMTTSAMKGCFYNESETRQELLQLVKG